MPPNAHGTSFGLIRYKLSITCTTGNAEIFAVITNKDNF
jgi:hypothetical protein